MTKIIHKGRGKSPQSRSSLGTTKFYKSKNMKRTIVLLPNNMWRLAKDISLDNGETFTAFVIRSIQTEINRHTEKDVVANE